MYTLLNCFLIVYTKAGFVICLVHRHLDCLFLLAPNEYPDGFGTPPLLSPISLAHPYLEGSPQEFKPLFWVALSLSFLTWTRRISSPSEANSGSPPVFPTQLISSAFNNKYGSKGIPQLQVFLLPLSSGELRSICALDKGWMRGCTNIPQGPLRCC